MGTNFLKIILVILIYSITVCATCNKKISCNETVYSFNATMRAFPDDDSININDTIWLEIDCSVTLVDISSGNSVNYSGAVNFSTGIDFFEFIGGNVNNPGVLAAVNAFEYKLNEGVFVPDNVVPQQNRDYN
jgi:hypothetical protein